MNEKNLSTPRRVLVAGSAGMVGSAVCRALRNAGIQHTGATRTHADLTSRRDVDAALAREPYDAVIIAAARVGGIHANDTYPADFIYENLAIEMNLIDAAHRAEIPRILFLGSSCIYPRGAAQPMAEDALLTGTLEPTNEAYAIAKIAGIKLCESYNRQYSTDYRSLMPTNLYGPGDNFHPQDSHVIPGLITRFHEAKSTGQRRVPVWGSGNPRREFLHVDDLAAAVVHVLCLDRSTYWAAVDERCSHLNVGTGEDVTIRHVADLIRAAVGLDAELEFDPSKPDGTPRKLLDVDRIKGLGWSAQIDLTTGLQNTYEWFLANQHTIRR